MAHKRNGLKSILHDHSYIFLKFVFSKKATKIDEIFTVDLTVCSVKSPVKIFSNFVAFLENTNFNSNQIRVVAFMCATVDSN